MFTARVRLYQPEGYTPSGELFVAPEALDWIEVDYLEPEQCQHQESICRGCSHSWASDYEIQLPSLV